MPQSDATQPFVTPPMSSLGFEPALSRTPPRAPRKRTRLLIGLALAVIIIAEGAGGAYLIRKNAGPSGSVAQIATATSQPTATPPPTAIPTATRPPASTATPAPRLVTLFFDPLTSNKNGWPTDASDCFFRSDGYHVANGAECLAPFKAPSNLNITVTTKFVQGSSIISYRIGFRVLSPNRQQYYLFITDSGGWLVFGPSGYVTSPHTSSVIHRGIGAVNTLEVACSGSHFTFYINGVNMGSATSGAVASGGVGLGIEPNQNAIGTEVAFTNFTITQWQ